MASSLLASSSKLALARRSPAFAKTLFASRAATTQSDALYVPGGPVYKGTVNDPHDVPAALQNARIPPLVLRAPAVRRAHPAHRRRVRHVPQRAPRPRRHPRCQPRRAQSHGLDSMVVDYLHPRKFPVLGPVATWTLRTATVGVLAGVYQFNTNDIGLTELIAKVWSA